MSHTLSTNYSNLEFFEIYDLLELIHAKNYSIVTAEQK